MSTTELVAVFHRVGKPTEDKMTHSLEQILNFQGQVTFDGAYESVYWNREKLAGKKPILFIQQNTIGEPGICTMRQINELVELHGFTLGWHGRTHRKLTELSDLKIMYELSNHMGLRLYAYPHGDWNPKVAKMVKNMGYLKAYSTTQGEEGNDYAIPRVYI